MSIQGGQSSVETICAIATPPGVGGIGVVRVSGPASRHIAEEVCGRVPVPRQAHYCAFRDASGATIDSGLALYFAAPNSFTGEDVLELQGHGGPVVLQLLMRRVVEAGARAARAGEFSERAFLNGKLDLTQAEAIADLVTAGTAAAARAATQSLGGAFSKQIGTLQQQLTGLRVFVEAAIDFPQEEIDFLADSDVLSRLQQAQKQVQVLLDEARHGRLLRDGAVLAIVGRPNAGKSSLLNALSGQDTAIVTEIPGTTRDVLHEWIDLDGIPVKVVDTAGIRDTTDRIEAEGVKRARAALASADIVLLIVDASAPAGAQDGLPEELPDHSRTITVFNKIDLLGQAPDLADMHSYQETKTAKVGISAKTGEGLVLLRVKIRELLGATEQADGGFSARQRHVDALRRTLNSLRSGEHRLIGDGAAELLAEELRLAQQSLGEITGEFVADDLLGAIFSSFCIGK